MALTQLAHPMHARLALVRETLELAPLGRELALELRPPHRQRPLLGGRLALIDQPLRAALLLARIGELAL